MFRRTNFNTTLVALVALSILSIAGSAAQVVASPVLQQAVRFLSPPFYGTTSVTSVFDHDLPLISTQANPNPDGNDWTTHYDGVRDGPSARSSYDQHRGIDYALRYDLVRAAAPGTVAQAGWASTNHRASYGLHVRIDHADGFRTIYGHMSVLHVETGDPVSESDEFQRILGRSGNTGWCAGWEGTGPDGRCTDNDPPTCGAHLHFQLEHNERVVNPYGWIGNVADPWSQRADGATSVDRWVRYPSITNSDVFTSGAPLLAPPMDLGEPSYFIVDDGDTDFHETAGCWTADNTAGWNNDYRRRDIPGGNCTATWNFAPTRAGGRYNVFVHIPNDNVAPGNWRATVDAARYTIRHTPASSQPWNKQTQIVVVDQWVYPNNAHESRWVYLGAYYFDTNQYGADYVRLESDTMDSRAGIMAADAVRFAPVRYRVYLPLVMKRWPPIPDIPVLNPINNSNGSSGYTVSWQAAYLASTYTLQEATNVEFTGAVTRYTGTGTSWTASGKAPGTYYYRVKATNSWGDSGWSNIQQTLVWPITTTFYSVADSTVQSGYPTANNGSSTVMLAGCYGGAQVMRGLVRFDLSGIPSGTPISQAQLWLYLSSSREPTQSTARTIATYRVASAWTESSVTWNTRPSFGSMYNWISIPHNAFSWYSVDVTHLMREWVNGQYPNYGIWLFGNESSTDQNWRGFSTREGAADRRPYLAITYGTGASRYPSNPGSVFISPLATPETPPDAPMTPLAPGEVIPLVSPLPTPTLP